VRLAVYDRLRHGRMHNALIAALPITNRQALQPRGARRAAHDHDHHMPLRIVKAAALRYGLPMINPEEILSDLAAALRSVKAVQDKLDICEGDGLILSAVWRARDRLRDIERVVQERMKVQSAQAKK
jgi:hypothetical protein